ncbi:hypothetical protein RD110_21945 [Rhodoferax koreense]|uniref:Uncharacterized protein n=1 Tax=Rhodoferax koreensis TaxID=1842727 RepID=A0A1P8K0L8_9BURK|nr:hypothetical protein [Rhodoferax koreense]APW39547.1 hypothetical protein RD110_21945 [Rhodoferax koreense]
MSRTTKVTPEAIAAAVVEIERGGNKPTVQAVQTICHGSTDVVTKGLKSFLELRESARASLRDSGVFEAFDVLCSEFHRHVQTVTVEGDRRIEDGLQKIGPTLAERDLAVAAQREAEAASLTLRTEVMHLRSELQHRDSLVAQSRTAQILSSEQARLAGVELTKCQVVLQQTQLQLKEKKREIKDTLRRTEEAVFQQRLACEGQLLLKRELAAKEVELRNSRNGWLEMTGAFESKGLQAVQSGAPETADNETPSLSVQSSEVTSLRAQVDRLTEKNKALADELQMALDLMGEQTQKIRGRDGQTIDIDVSA